jgi:hypothetical protein
VNRPDLEAQTTPKIKDALKAAIQRTGLDEFARLSKINASILKGILEKGEEYVSISVLTLACQINRSNGDSELSRTSISECLKGAILRLPQTNVPLGGTVGTSPKSNRQRREAFKARKHTAGRSDSSSLRIIGYTANIVVFFILGYFIGGVALGPLLGFSGCVGVMGASPWVTPCTGSILGLIAGAIVWLGYTYYYFVRKV